MKSSDSLYRAMLGVVGVWLLQGGAAVHAAEVVADTPPSSSASQPAAYAGASEPQAAADASASAPSAPAPTSATVAAGDAGAADGDVAKLTRLIHDPQLAEMRTTYNGSYGASLFFYPPEMAWYVALFQNRHFWRVVRSENEASAQTVYEQFVRQTVDLAKAELRVTRLEAERAQIERLIALSDARARRLQADLAIAQAQQADVDSSQRQLRKQTASLESGKQRASEQLRDSEIRVRALQRAMDAGFAVPRARTSKAR